jgi:hypothetical protein
LLSGGRHWVTLDELRALCVAAFFLSKRRELLLVVVTDVLRALSGENIIAEVWIDGSFLTRKIDPDDVDLVVVLDAENVPPATATAAWAVLHRINDQEFNQPLKCDSYLYWDVPKSHPQFRENEIWRAYWLRQFCFSRKAQIKGLAVVNTPL